MSKDKKAFRTFLRGGVAMSSSAPIFYSHSLPDSASRGGHMPKDEPSLIHGQPGDETKPAAVPGPSPRSHGAAHSSSISSVTSMPSSAMKSLSMTPLSIPVENSPFFGIVCNRHRLAHCMQPVLWKNANWHPPPNRRIDSIIALFAYSTQGSFSLCRWVSQNRETYRFRPKWRPSTKSPEFGL